MAILNVFKKKLIADPPPKTMAYGGGGGLSPPGRGEIWVNFGTFKNVFKLTSNVGNDVKPFRKIKLIIIGLLFSIKTT